MDVSGRLTVFGRAIGCGLLLGVPLSGCGTNVPQLLAQDSALYWEADEFLASVEDMNLGLEDAVNRAEQEKIQACKKLYKAVKIRIVRELHEGPLPFGEKFLYDAKLLLALLMPLGSVERCRAAVELYEQEYVRLRDALPPRDGIPKL